MRVLKILVFIALLAAVVLVSVAVCRENDVRKQRAYDQVVSIILNDGMRSQSRGMGVIALPSKWSSLTARGVVYVNRYHGMLLIIFPTWQGRDANLQGYLYAENPLIRSQLDKDYYGKVVIPFVVGDRTHGDVGESVPMELGRRVRLHWYLVSRSLD